MARFGVLLLLVLCSSVSLAQTTPSSTPPAVALATKSIAAMTDGNSIGDATLTANVTTLVGSQTQTGTVNMYAKGSGESRLDLHLGTSNTSELRNDTAGFPQGETVNANGAVQPWALHNCWVNASWFFPALSFLSATSDPNLVFFYLGQETSGGQSVQHLRVYRYLAGQTPHTISFTQQLSTVDFYLNSVSLLPIATTFNTHPDSDGGTDFTVVVLFSNYQSINGVQVPLHIQKFLNGAPVLDAVVTGATFNSGLPDTLFAIQ